MKTYRVPRTDLTVSRLAFGCAMLGLDWKSADFIPTTASMIATASEQGITLFDLADLYGYGKAELALGQVLKNEKALRQRIVIQTKCGDRFADGKGTSSVDNSAKHILSSVNGSLERLGTDYLDLFLLHWPDNLVDPHEVAEAFDQLHRSGKVRYFGVSNHSPTQIELLKKHVAQPLVTNQIQLGLAHWAVASRGWKGHLVHGAEGAATLDYCRLHDMQVQAYSPLRAGDSKGSVNLLRPAKDASEQVIRAANLLAEIAREHNSSPAAVMIAWLLRHPAQIVPILGATKRAHLIENCQADRIELTHDEWYRLLQAAAAIEAEAAT